MDARPKPAKILHPPRPAKILHRGVFIERQGLDATGYKYVSHTGIAYFLPDKFDTPALARAAVDAKLKTRG